jgi:hypothetical protein
MNLRQMITATAVALAAVASMATAHAAATIPTAATYDITLPNFAVTDIVAYNLGSPFATVEQGPSTSPQTAGTPGPTRLTDTYLTAAEIGIPGFVYVPGQTFLLGVTSGLPGDAPGQQHLVVFANNSFAQSAVNIAFGTLFPNTNETTLINDLTTEENVGDIFNFAAGDALTGPNGSIFFEPGDNFTAVAFSNGQIIGTGTSSFTTDLPEPASWTLLVIGLGGLGAAMRSRRKDANGKVDWSNCECA